MGYLGATRGALERRVSQSCCPTTERRSLLLCGHSWARKTFSYVCEVKPGNMGPALEGPSHVDGANTSAPLVTPPGVVFEGNCYHCGTPGHSQNYCPLRLCFTCRNYGHSDKACAVHARGSCARRTCPGRYNNCRCRPTRTWTYNCRHWRCGLASSPILSREG